MTAKVHRAKRENDMPRPHTITPSYFSLCYADCCHGKGMTTMNVSVTNTRMNTEETQAALAQRLKEAVATRQSTEVR